MKPEGFHTVMGADEPFQATHADREVNRIASAPELVRWTSPSGVCLDLHLPATVYPPREDTDLLISALGPHHLRQGSSWREIGCGSGVVSWWAATNGCRVTACDINPLAVATTRGLLAQHGLSARVHEGGPGPAVDGGLDQWGGEQLYDTVVWNTPYLSSNVLEAGALGPMEEAALTDTDDQGLVPRLLELIAAGRLLNERGTAFVTVSSRGIGLDAQAVAWRHGLAMRSVASTEFGDGETLQVLAIWRPYVGSPVVSLPTTKSTNDEVLQHATRPGASVRAGHQSAGRGRRGRDWETTPGALLASWLVGSGPSVEHGTLDQLRVGEGLIRLVRSWSGSGIDDVVLKWPNDVWIRSSSGILAKSGGVLFEALSRGDRHRVALGIGLNTSTQEDGWCGVDGLGLDVPLDDLHQAVHAMVASLFERVEGLPQHDTDLDHLCAAVVAGASAFEGVFYRNKAVRVVGVDADGFLLLQDDPSSVSNPDDMTWSVVQDGVEDVIT